MDFGELLYAAKRNEHKAKVEPVKCYRTSFTPPKKEQKNRSLSSNIQKFLRRKEEEEKRKEIATKKKRDGLLALRSQDGKANKRVQAMLKRTKAANKSVIEDAIDDDNTAVTLDGPSQPDEDDYGYVSQEASAFYNKLMDKYQSTPVEEPAFPQRPLKTAHKDLNSTKDRVRMALLKEEEEEMMPHKRKRKSKDKSKEVDEGDTTTNYTSSDMREIETYETNYEEEAEVSKPKKPHRPAPPSMDFSALLKLAEKKQFEPVKVEPRKEPKDDEERPMTKKQKLEYMKEQEWRRKKEEAAKGNRAPDKQMNVNQQRIPKLSDSVREEKQGDSIPRIPKLNNKDERSNSTSSQQRIPKLSDGQRRNDIKPKNNSSDDRLQHIKPKNNSSDDRLQQRIPKQNGMNNRDDRNRSSQQINQDDRGKGTYVNSKDDRVRNSQQITSRDHRSNATQRDDRGRGSQQSNSRDDRSSGLQQMNRDDRYKSSQQLNNNRHDKGKEFQQMNNRDDRSLQKVSRSDSNNKDGRPYQRTKDGRLDERAPVRDEQSSQHRNMKVNGNLNNNHKISNQKLSDGRNSRDEIQCKPVKNNNMPPPSASRQNSANRNSSNEQRRTSSDDVGSSSNNRTPQLTGYSKKLQESLVSKLQERRESTDVNRNRKPTDGGNIKSRNESSKPLLKPRGSKDSPSLKPMKSNEINRDSVQTGREPIRKEGIGKSPNKPSSLGQRPLSSGGQPSRNPNDGRPVPLSSRGQPSRNPNDGRPVPLSSGGQPSRNPNDGWPVPLSSGRQPSRNPNDGRPVPPGMKGQPLNSRDSKNNQKDIKSRPASNVEPRQFPPADVKPRQFPPPDVRPRQFPPPDVRRKQFPPSGVRRRDRPPMKRRIEDSDEYDSEMDDFIDDGPQDDEDVSQHIREIFGYDRRRYQGVSDDDECMESNFAQQLKEEFVSTKMGILEDLEDIKMEQMEKKKKSMTMKKKQRL